MSLEAAIKELNSNIDKLNGILEVYPNVLDQATGIDKAPKADTSKESETDNTSAAKPKHTSDELAALAKEVLTSNKTEARPKIKEKMDALGISKVTATPDEHIDEVYEFLEGLK